MEEIKVSVIVPVYNVEPYVSECIESILRQSLREIEIIVVDDCSTDDSYNICKRYEANDPDRIRLFRHEKNMGLPAARNTGLRHAKGDYIGFVDSDDRIGADRFKDFYENAVRHDSDITFCWTIPPEELREGSYADPCYTNTILGKFLVYLSGDGAMRNYSVSTCRRLFKREFLETNHIAFLETLRSSEDRLFAYQCHFRANSFYYLAENEGNGYFYRQRADSIVHSYKPDDWKMRKLIVTSLSEFLRQDPRVVERVEIYEKKIPLLTFMFAMWSVNHLFQTRQKRHERIRIIDRIINDPLCAVFDGQIDARLLNEENRKYYALMCAKDAAGLDKLLLSKAGGGRSVLRSLLRRLLNKLSRRA